MNRCDLLNRLYQMESRGNVRYPYGNISTVLSTLHWGPNPYLNKYSLTQAEVHSTNGTFADNFHTFGRFI